ASMPGTGYLFKGQRYDSNGNATGSEFQVASLPTSNQSSFSAATGLQGGGFVVAWENGGTATDGSGSAVQAQRFDSSGQPVGAAFVVNELTTGNQNSVALATLADGSFVATWTTNQPAAGGTLSEVKGRLFDSSGTALGSEFLVNTTTTGSQTGSSLTALQSGGFLATWISGSGASGVLYGQFFDSSGNKQAGEIALAGDGPGYPLEPSVTELADGRVVVAWRNYPDSGFNETINGRIFDSSGVLLGSEFVISNPGGNSQTGSPQVKALPDGGFIATWSHPGGTDVSTAVWARFYDAAGTPGTSFLVNTAQNLFEQGSRTLVTSGGDVVVTWSSSFDPHQSDVNARFIALNKAPAIQSDGGGATASFTVAEDQLVVTQVVATDLVGPAAVTYSIAGGADAALFAIDSTGHLTFLAAPDAEAPADADLDNVYEVVVSAGDGELSDTQALSVTVAGTGRGLLISSSAQASAFENALAAARVSATDGAATFAITGGADSAHFQIDPATGLLSFIAAPNFEAPTDSGSNNVYDVEVTATAAGQSVAQSLAITVRNVNEGPAFTTPTSASVTENSTTFAIAALDTEGDALTYKIVGGADSDKMYINTTTGVLSFYSAPNFEAPGDVGANGVYDVIVRAADGDLAVTQAFAITIANVNEGVMISSNGAGAAAAFSIQENQSVATTVTSRDNPTGTSVTYSLVTGSDSSKFAINAQTGVLSFVTAPNFESPTDGNRDNVYQVTVKAFDGTVTDTQALSITVTNVNEAFSITSFGGGDTAQVAWNENNAGFTITTNEQDAGNLTFTIVGGADASRFAFSWANGKDGNFNFTPAPNFEAPGDSNADNVYHVTIQASDGTHTDTQAITFTVANVNEAPVITTNGGGASATVSIVENGTAVTTVAATDVDGTTAFTYSISGGADASKFTINSATGALRFVNAPNFEVRTDVGANNVYDVVVKVSDGSLFDTQAIAVTVTNLNEAPVITSGGGGASAVYSVAENGSFVGTQSASDPESTSVSWSIVGGADAAKFTINWTGGLNFVAAPNFESPTDSGANNVYDVIVQASDGTFTDTQAIAVTVTNVNEAPVITSGGAGATAAITVGENGLVATTVASTDPENTARTYSISGGVDAAKFSIDAATGVLSFVAAPDFEAPADSGANNVYDVIVRASDGILADTQALAVTVANVNEAPVIGSNGGGAAASVQVDENGLAVTTVLASDPDGGAPSFAIAGGADSALFAIDPATGALTFLAAPDFEAPGDSNSDNVYEVTVSAGDGSLFDLQDISVSVADLLEGEGAAFPSSGHARMMEAMPVTEYTI
ncbi:MAG TPA: cadherin domain-containing protein, partial [Allosphingosinicella sp.]